MLSACVLCVTVCAYIIWNKKISIENEKIDKNSIFSDNLKIENKISFNNNVSSNDVAIYMMSNSSANNENLSAQLDEFLNPDHDPNQNPSWLQRFVNFLNKVLNRNRSEILNMFTRPIVNRLRHNLDTVHEIYTSLQQSNLLEEARNQLNDIDGIINQPVVVHHNWLWGSMIIATSFIIAGAWLTYHMNRNTQNAIDSMNRNANRVIDTATNLPYIWRNNLRSFLINSLSSIRIRLTNLFWLIPSWFRRN